jgi:DNA-binding NarL/FixJ family response regulator
MIRVAIADDHPIVRTGIRQILEESAAVRVVAEAGDARELFDALSTIDCDVLLLDISMPGMNALDALRQLRSAYPGIAVLILTMHPEDQFALRMLKAGAAGYLTKAKSPGELLKAVRQIARGGRYLSEPLADILLGEIGWENRGRPHEKLSNREFQVLCMIAGGLTISAVAGQLGISVKTASTYRGRILGKMNMKNNAELMRYALKSGLCV